MKRRSSLSQDATIPEEPPRGGSPKRRRITVVEKKPPTAPGEFDEMNLRQPFPYPPPCFRRRFDPKDLAKYKREVEEGEGFDITFFPYMMQAGCIWPIGHERCPRDGFKKINRDPWISHAHFAVNHHNMEAGHDRTLKLLKVVNMNMHVEGSYLTHYITLQALDSHSDSDRMPKTFQARLLKRPGFPLELLLFREKPASSSSSSSSSGTN